MKNEMTPELYFQLRFEIPERIEIGATAYWITPLRQRVMEVKVLEFCNLRQTYKISAVTKENHIAYSRAENLFVTYQDAEAKRLELGGSLV